VGCLRQSVPCWRPLVLGSGSVAVAVDASPQERVKDISEERWGRLTRFRLPGGGNVGIYEPRHPLAIDL